MDAPEAESWITEVRERLADPPPKRLPRRKERQAAVLVPLYVDAGELWTVLTRRTRELPHHKGQISFPGGSMELGEEPWDAARRETEEEIGVESAAILELGRLDEVETPTGFQVVPCVGVLPHPFEADPDESEIAEVFAVPLSALANPTMVEERAVDIDGTEHRIVVYHVGTRRIWGLTGRIIEGLLGRLGLVVEQ